jgi:putative ABC transport system substrate-binding protein
MRRLLGIALFAAIFGMAGESISQQPSSAKNARIGLLGAEHSSSVEAFRQGLRDLGWVDGQNLIIEFRFVHGSEDRLAMIAGELVGLGMDVIVTSSVTYIEPARRATQTIPIVFCTHYGPVEAGHVDSLKHPGGNLTGLTNPGPEMTAKRLELLKEAVPTARRIAVLWPRATGAPAVLGPTEAAARALGVELQPVQARSSDELDDAVAAVVSAGADALLVPPSVLALRERARLPALALKHRLPSIFGFRESIEAGGLMSYAADFNDQFRRCAGYVDKILRGARPAELPVEQASNYQLAINLQTAQALGIQFPLSLLARADEVIE